MNSCKLYVSGQTLIDIATYEGFDKGAYFNDCEASAFLEKKLNKLIFPTDHVNWVIKFKNSQEQFLFRLRYSDYLC